MNRHYALGITLNHCPCGATPKVMHCRVAEDAEEAWVQCDRCGRQTDRCEDAYADFETAEWLWQKGRTHIPDWWENPGHGQSSAEKPIP